MNLTYSQLLADLHALNLHQLAETNVEVVTNEYRQLESLLRYGRAVGFDEGKGTIDSKIWSEQ